MESARSQSQPNRLQTLLVHHGMTLKHNTFRPAPNIRMAIAKDLRRYGGNPKPNP